MTIKAGTSLRAEGTISRFADSSIDSTVDLRPPRCCRIPQIACWRALGASLRGINLPGTAQWAARLRMQAAWQRVIDGRGIAAGLSLAVGRIPLWNSEIA